MHSRKKGGEERLVYLLHANLAELRYRSRAFEESLAAADRALASARRAKEGDKVGVAFTKAKALAATGKKDEALAIFDAAKDAKAMTGEDLEVHVRLLAEKGRFADALTRVKERRALYGYQAGQGLEESIFYEKLGKLSEAAAAAFEELDRRRFHADLADSAVLAGLAEAKKRLASPGTRDSAGGKDATAVLAGAERFTRGEYAAASTSFAGVKTSEAGTYLDFLAAASAAEAGTAGALERLVALESRYRDYQGFYYHLWRALKKGPGLYGLETVRGVLEKCILLAPASAAARETREELGLLLGLGREDGRKLLLGQELDALASALAAGASPRALEPAMELLTTKDNPYRLSGQLFLKKAATLPTIRVWLEKRRAEASGRLKEALGAVLGG